MKRSAVRVWKRSVSRFGARLLCALLLLISASSAHAQTAAQMSAPGGVVLVLPFDNRSGQSSLDWVSESFAETISARLQSAGFYTIDRADREYALDHLGLPQGFRPTRATSIRLGQTLDASYIIVGSYTMSGNRMAAQAQVIRVNELNMTSPLDDSADLQRLLDLENALAWKIARNMDPNFSVALDTFISSSRDVKLEAYENYIRGIVSRNDDERLHRFQAAVQISPDYSAALLALGKTLYAQRSYDEAAKTLARISRNDPHALEANFYLGLSYFNAAHYSEAEQAFAFVASRLPLPEVVNNQGVALARQKKDATPLLQRASSADPQDADYHFNVAVSLRRRGDTSNARAEIEKSLKIRPNDTEAQEIRAALNSGRAQPGFDPQERIRRTYSEAGVRQAVFQMDQMRAMKSATLPPQQRAEQDAQAGQDYLSQGFVPEAEREFQNALKAYPNSAVAHAGLAQVRERTGNLDQARQEAQQSLQLRPTVAAYLVLARLDLAANQLPQSAQNVANALKLEPTNGAALGIKQALASRGQTIP